MYNFPVFFGVLHKEEEGELLKIQMQEKKCRFSSKDMVTKSVELRYNKRWK